MGLIKTQIDGKSAESRFHVLPEVLVEPGLTLCAFEIVTGRKRQIRNHAARALGAPIYGDPHFGTGGDTTAPPSIALHSSKLLIDVSGPARLTGYFVCILLC
jgi:tRNA pseudouridine32 synthase/23S rRNA pseudouridine746 synthase